uniref:DNA/RNA-binding protein Alba-like domain-containing protein n=2 Tax=Denticeps clupeoides TaxID=299321 RepID=A0AAY4B7G7_9TELE
MELDVAPNRFLPFQGENYIVPQPPSTNTIICTTEVSPAPPPPPAQLLKPGQGGFKKVCRTEDEGPSPFPGLASGVLEMRVKEGSKIRNLMGFAMTRMQGTAGPEGGQPGLRQVVFTGSGRAVTKTITCAEIMKRKIAGLHQLSKLRYKGVREVWESQEGGGSEMTVHRTVPSISILLSRDPLDPREPGYQPPESLGALWGEQPATKRLPDPPDHAGLPGSKRPCLGNGRVVCGPAE